MEFTPAMAIALVGSVASICLTIYKILGSRKNSKDCTELQNLKEKTAVQEEQIKDLSGDVKRQEHSLERLTDLLLRLLTEK